MHRAESDRLAVWAAFLRAHATVIAQLERELTTERDLSLTWYDVLFQLSSAGRELRMQELARSVLLSKSGLTRLVDRMEAAGLVARRTCDFDRRGTWVGLTPEGKTTLRRAAPVHLRGVGEHFLDKLDDDDLAALKVALDKVLGEGAGDEAECDEPLRAPEAG
jgi:DNA-binding MarR family transcriptional regulator